MERRFAREAAINRLIEHTLESIHQDPDGEILRAIVRRGFLGFEELSDSRLETELRMRGLSAAAGPLMVNDGEGEPTGVDELAHEMDEILSLRYPRFPVVEGG